MDLLTSTHDPDVARDGAFDLIEFGKVTEARQIFLSLLKNNPNDVQACIGLATLHAIGGQWTESEAMLDRAIMLRPSPSVGTRFHRTITVWMDRGDAGRARDWVRKSATRHYDSWQSAKLFESAVQCAELADTVNEVRAIKGDPPLGRRCGSVGVVVVVGILTSVAMFFVIRLLKNYRGGRSIAS